MSIHQEVPLPGSPLRIYEALTDATKFSAVTGGAPAQIAPEAGGAFSLFGGMIEGRNIELVPGQRVVQAWRPKNWPPGLYSLVRFEFSPQGAQTLVVFDHVGFPDDQGEHLTAGWEANYWAPLRKYLG